MHEIAYNCIKLHIILLEWLGFRWWMNYSRSLRNFHNSPRFYFINNPPINSIASQARIWRIIHLSHLLSQNKRFILVKSTSVVYLYNVIFRMNPCPNIQCWIKPFTLEQYYSLDGPTRIFQFYNFLKLTIIVILMMITIIIPFDADATIHCASSGSMSH